MNNTFLASLEAFVQKEGVPSTVRYRASASEQSNEVHLYVSIIELLKNNKVINDKGTPDVSYVDGLGTGGVYHAI